MNEVVQWLVKNKKGEVQGPLTHKEVIQKILTGVYFGEELISPYPSEQWKPISHNQDFFDLIIKLLEREFMGKEPSQVEQRKELTQRIQTLRQENQQREDSKNIKKEEKNLGRAVSEDIESKPPAVEMKEKTKLEVGRAVADEQKPKKKKPAPKLKPKAKTPKPPKRKNKPFRARLFVLFIVMSCGLYIYLIQNPSNPGKLIHLRTPRDLKGQSYDQKMVNQNIHRAIIAFRKDSFKGYSIAQDALIEFVEKSKGELDDAYAFLCMTYRELWPFSYQDGKDHGALQVVLRKVQKIDPKSSSANICLVVSHWVRGHYDDALRIMENHLAQWPDHIFFNQMTGDIYSARKQYQEASYYFSKVRELWQPPPVWSKTLLQEARMYRKLGNYRQAVALYNRLLKENPSHAVAKVELGLVEFDPYQNIDKARDYILAGLLPGEKDHFIPKMVESEAYVVLAKISIFQGDNKKALEFFKKAFSIDSSNQEARDMIKEMGGSPGSVSVNNLNMVRLGEQYMKRKNFNQAQAAFRGAYEANPRSAFAALRAGEAFWKLNQSEEAIQWIKRSIRADPSFIRGYLILADYQSARFDYVNAIETLKAALKVNPRHHGVYRGFALVELRRKNYDGVMKFAKKALELYDTDVKTLLILAEALYEKNEPEEAFQHVYRAQELDPSDERVHILLAHVMTKLQGTDAGIDYLNRLSITHGKADYVRALGDLLVREERKNEAKEKYLEALNQNPRDKKALMDLAGVSRSEKDPTQARDYLLQAAILDPSDAQPLFILGQIYLESNQSDKALKQFVKVIRINPNYPRAYYYAGRAHLAEDDFEQALEMAEKERLMNPNIPESFLLAAEVYYRKKQYGSCADKYKEVLVRGLKTSEIFINLARCYRLSGNLDSAFTMLNEAKEVESGNPNIHKELGALYHTKGSYEKAIKAYRDYLKMNPQAEDKGSIKIRINNIQSSANDNG